MEKINIATYNITGAINSTNRFYSRIKKPKFQDKINEAKLNLEKIATFIEEKDLSIITLQEVDICYNGNEKLHQAEFLADHLSMNYRYVAHSNYSLPNGLRVTTGLAMFTKYDILNSKVINFDQSRLPFLQKMKKLYVGNKKALCSVVDTGEGVINVISSHLTHNSDKQKEFELKTLLDVCLDNSPSLLMGDLNSTPSITREGLEDKDWFYKTDNAMSILRRYSDFFQYDPRLGDFRLMPTNFNDIMTSPSDLPNKKIDYLFLFPYGGDFSLSQEEVIDLRISDHRPVLAHLNFKQ